MSHQFFHLPPRRLGRVLWLAAAFASATASLPAADTPKAKAPAVTPAPTGPDFNSFRIVLERNIFNPNRIGRTRAGSDEVPTKVDQVALVGTLQSDQGDLALFDGSESAFRKSLRAGQTVAGFTVKDVQANAVQLEKDGKALSLKVGQQLTRPPGGEWVASVREIPRPEEPRTGAAPVTTVPNDASEVLRRLMEARQKQLKQ